jgi:CBS domain-containing protein
MRIRNIMSKHIEQTVADATLMEAAGLMTALDVGMLPVFDGEELVGVVTDRDIVTRAVAEGRDPALTRVRDVMTEEVISCSQDDDDVRAARLMEEHRVRRLLVLNSEGRPVGICSLADIARRARDRNLTADIVQEVVQPSAASHS